MRLKRFWRHVRMSPLVAKRAFSPATLDAIQREIAAQEKRHRGEICMVVEAELSSAQLWDDVSPRTRARELFAQRGVWNTEENNGVLVYLLLADRSVEIVADRGIDARAGMEEWHAICRMMERHFTAGRYEQGAIEGVRAISELLALHFPAGEKARNELPDRPVIL
jgi:uncharacterized membrane protein